jgi:hypothetical protein
LQVKATKEESNERTTNLKPILGKDEYTPIKITGRKEVNEKDSENSERTTVNPVLIWRKQVKGTKIHQNEYYNRGRGYGGRMRPIEIKKEVKINEDRFEKIINGEVHKPELAKLSEEAAKFDSYSKYGSRIKPFDLQKEEQLQVKLDTKNNLRQVVIKNTQTNRQTVRTDDVQENAKPKAANSVAKECRTDGKIIPTPRQRPIFSNTKLQNSSFVKKRKYIRLGFHGSNVTEIADEIRKEKVGTKLVLPKAALSNSRMITRASFSISVQNDENINTIKRQLEEETSDGNENLGKEGRKQTFEKIKANNKHRQTKSKHSIARDGEKNPEFARASNFRRRGEVSLKKGSDDQEYVQHTKDQVINTYIKLLREILKRQNIRLFLDFFGLINGHFKIFCFCKI